jgi:signal transduction histidine kinase
MKTSLHPTLPKTSPNLDSDARALAELWFDTRTDERILRARAEQIAATAQARGEQQTARLSCAFEAMRAAALHRQESDTRARVGRTLALQLQLQSRAADDSPRALRLAQAAWAHTLLHAADNPDDRALALDMLQSHGPAESDPRPPQERFWSDAGLCLLYCAIDRPGQAIACGRRAQTLARRAGHDLLLAQAAQALALAFLNAGDAARAATLLREALEANRRCGRPLLSSYYHLMLALVLGRDFDAASQLLDGQPWLFDPPLLARMPGLCALAALVQAQQGRDSEAHALLAELPEHLDGHTMATEADCIWTHAEAELVLGDAAAARQRVERALEGFDRVGVPVSALNRVQLQRVLRRAWAAMDGLSPQALREAVDKARAEAEAALQQQTLHRRFLAHIAHEMRNPATGVSGLTALLLTTPLTPEQRQQLELVQNAAQMMTGLCDDLLDLARMEAGGFELRPAAVDVGAVLSAATQTLLPMAQSKQLALTWSVADPLPRRLLCDGLRLQQLLLNLLGNAIKFTPDGAVAVVAGWQPSADVPGSGRLRVAVQDTGPGLDAQAQSRLFVEFSQIEPPTARGLAGHGLGLALCRSLVRQMGGEIGVDSRPGAGSTFWFSLPLQVAVAGEQADASAA